MSISFSSKNKRMLREVKGTINSQMGYYMAPLGVKLNAHILMGKMEGLEVKLDLQKVLKET